MSKNKVTEVFMADDRPLDQATVEAVLNASIAKLVECPHNVWNISDDFTMVERVWSNNREFLVLFFKRTFANGDHLCWDIEINEIVSRTELVGDSNNLVISVSNAITDHTLVDHLYKRQNGEHDLEE